MKERKFVQDAVNRLLITEYIKSETDTAGYGGMEMKRTPFGNNVTLHVNKPGLVIGRRGMKVQEITEHLERVFKVESPQIEVKEVDKPDLNPFIVSKKIALTLEKGWSYRRAGNTALRRTVESKSKGVIIRIGGKLSGERARSQKFISGSIKYSGEPARVGMLRGFAVAKLKLGIIGISVGILNSDYRLPDEIDVSPPKIVESTATITEVKGGEPSGTESKTDQGNEQ